MTDTLWRSVRAQSVGVYVEYEHTYANLFATDVKIQLGPPVALSIDLESTLRTRSKTTGTYLDARALADGAIRGLTLFQLSDDRAREVIDNYLTAADEVSAEWILQLRLKGVHKFRVRPEHHSHSLFFRVLGDLPPNPGSDL